MLSAVTTSLLVCVVNLFIWYVVVCCLCVCVPDVLVCGLFGCEQLDRPKHLEQYSVNSKILHLVGFTIEIYHDARSHERQSIIHIH